ncbi:MAG: response regulator [Chthoniobacterales bacterium]
MKWKWHESREYTLDKSLALHGFATTVPPVKVHSAREKLRILVVEDHADTRAILKAILESMGHRVKAVATLREGRNCLRAAEIDVVFSDIVLPDGMGWDLLNGFAFPPHFFAVAMSGHVDSYYDEIKQAGFCCRIDKPISRQDIVASLSRCFAPPVQAL